MNNYLKKNHPFDVLFSGDAWKGSKRYKKTDELFSKLGASTYYFPYAQRISTIQIKENLRDT